MSDLLPRRRAVLLLLALGALALVFSMPVWVHAEGSSALADDVDLAVAGTTAAPAVSAAALVLAAAALALGLVGPIARWIVVVVVAASGLVVTVGALAVARNPVASASAEAARVTGVAQVHGDVTVTAYPWIAAVVGLLAVTTAVGAAVAARGWPATGRRHERVPGTDAADDDPAALWDETTRGTEADRPRD